MAIATLSDLRAEIAEECLRANHRGFQEAFPRMLQFAENRIYDGGGAPMVSPPVRVTEMEVISSLTFTAGSATRPSDFLEARKLVWDGDIKAAPQYEPPSVFTVNRSIAFSGFPATYTIEGTTVLLSPKISGTLLLTYYAKPTPMTGDDDTNAVLVRYPNLYFSACLIEAYNYMRNDMRRSSAFGDYSSIVNGLSAADIRKKTGGTNLFPRIRGASVT